jgi:hypothetical protein
MTNQVTARIQWVSPAAGGRNDLPAGPKYITVARFKSQGSDWINDAWSLIVDFISPINDDLSLLAKVKFLAEEGPSSWLKEGAAFELMEGNKVVASGVIAQPDGRISGA